MPKSYNRHYKDYRKQRQSKIPRRNLQLRYRSLVTGVWHDLETRTTWAPYKDSYDNRTLKYRGDREEDAFNLGKETTERQIEEIKSEISSLKWILTPVCSGYSDGESRREYWYKNVVSQLHVRNHNNSYNIREIQKAFLRLSCTHDDHDYYSGRPTSNNSDVCSDFRINLPNPSHEDSPFLVLKKDGNYANNCDYYWKINPDSVDKIIDQALAYKQRMIDQNKKIDFFMRATAFSSRCWVYPVDDLSEDNPYREFRLNFEQGLLRKRARLTELESHLILLQEQWDSYYSDIENLRKVQDERDKAYRQRVERKAELRASLSVKRKKREQEQHETLVKQVQAEMQQWRDNVHAGKDTCGCTSAPNSEGIRTLKVNYATLEAATAAAKSALINSNLHLRPYKCQAKKKGSDGRHYSCGGFHLTSAI
jgi:hypothetical protein